jgi:hypothetical protein
MIHKPPGPLETLALVVIGKDGELPVFLHPHNPPISVLVDRESALSIQREAV